MRTLRTLWVSLPVLSLLLLCVHQVVAQDAAAPPAANAAAPTVIAPGDRKALDASMGNEAIVEGTVSSAQWSASGAVFLVKFTDGDTSQFQGALLARNREPVEKAFGDLANALEGAKIQLKGKLQMYREHPEILIEKPEQIVVLEKGPGNSPHAGGPATRPAAAARLFGVYGNMTTLTDDQRSKIAAIQQEGHDAELAYEKKLRDEQDAKIEALLTDDQRKQLTALKAESNRSFQSNSSATGGDKD